MINTQTFKLYILWVARQWIYLIQDLYFQTMHKEGVMTKSEDVSEEGKALKQLQEAIAFLEELQECQKRPLKHGNRDVQDLMDGNLDTITDGLKQFHIDLEMKNDHSGNCSH